jgi:hypothetical protein
MILRKFGIYIPEYILSYPEDHSMNFHLGRKPDFHVYVYWRRQKKIDVRIWRRSLKPQQFRTATCHQCGLVGTGGAVTNSVLSSCLSKCFHDFHGRYAEARGSCQVCWKLCQVSSSARHYGTLCSSIHPTRCNATQFIYIWKLLYMFRVVPPPIIRDENNCLYSIWYLSHRYCYLPLSWKGWNLFECAVGGVLICFGVDFVFDTKTDQDITHSTLKPVPNLTIAAGSSNGVTNTRCCR